MKRILTPHLKGVESSSVFSNCLSLLGAGLIGLVMFGIIMGLSGGSGADPVEQLNGLTVEQLHGLIHQLGADDYQKRETADKELTQLGDRLIEQYRKVKLTAETQRSQKALELLKDEITKLSQALREGAQSKDPEIKMRANNIQKHLYSSVSPKIAFVSDRDGNPQIYVMDADGKNQTRLTEDKAANSSPAWSPDGKRIAFVVAVRKGNYEIYVMDADGKNRTRLTEDKAFCRQPAWSPDGKRIAFASDTQIYVMDADGKNQTGLTENNGSNYFPAWSPDGKRIAFVSYRDGHKDIYVMDSDGKNQTRLTRNKGDVEHPAWSPDGTKIAFMLVEKKLVNVVDDGNPQIYVMDSDGKNQTRLTETKTQNISPTWSPDGKKIAFMSNRDRSGKSNFGKIYDCQIYVMDSDGKNQTRLTENNAVESDPAWSPILLSELIGLFAPLEMK